MSANDDASCLPHKRLPPNGEPSSSCCGSWEGHHDSSSAAGGPAVRLKQWLAATSSRCLGFWRGYRTQQQQDRRLLLFWPWFVECAFQKHYYNSILSMGDNLCLVLDVIIWLLCCLTMSSATELVLITLFPTALAIYCCAYKYAYPERYMRRRAVLTALRRLVILPILSLVHLRRPVIATNAWQAALIQVFVLSGSMHAIVATFFFLSSFWVRGVVEIAFAAVVLATAAPTGCHNILSGPYPDAGWRSAAALMDRTAFNIYSSSLIRPDMAHQVCCATLNTSLVVCSCLAAYLLHWFERRERLRFKAQVPPAVAAMQTHIYGLPIGLVAAQALLLLLHPAMVLGWMGLGAWHGLLAARWGGMPVPADT